MDFGPGAARKTKPANRSRSVSDHSSDVLTHRVGAVADHSRSAILVCIQAPSSASQSHSRVIGMPSRCCSL
eukprot:6973133-Prymnesium_polylepis.1